MPSRYVDDRLVQSTLDPAASRAPEARLRRPQPRGANERGASRSGLGFLKASAGRVSRKEVALFSQTLATLLASGTPLLSAIELIRNEVRSPAFQAILDKMGSELRAGISLHDAMAKAPKAFPPLYIRLIEAGERSGTLETVLRHLAAYLQREINLHQQLKKALTYPAIVLVVGLVVVGMMVTVVLPTFVDLLTGFSTSLPLVTRIVIGASHFAQAWKLQVMVGLFVVALGAAWYVSRPEGRREVDRLILKAPALGTVALYWDLARFSRTMSLLQGAGLPVAESLQLARDGASNRIFKEAIADTRGRVMEGESLAQSLRNIPFLPGLYIQLVKIGEESGTLESNLSSSAELYERDMDERITTLTSLLEPALTLAMGGLVTFIALSVLLPMLSLLSNFQTP